MTNDSDAIRSATLVPWLADHVAGLTPPVRFDVIAGGSSNLTYLVTDADDQRWVLRRPPAAQALATAHDMGREDRILRALAPTDVPVPTVVATCEHDEITGAPFYVMDHIEGNVVRNRADAETMLAVSARRQASESLVHTLAAIHAIDPDDVNLSELGRREGYVARQLDRWSRQLDRATSVVPEQLVTARERLAARMPDQRYTGIVHGDYRIDNCIVASSGTVEAVLDWELCTLGDTLADLGLLLAYWADPDDDPASKGVIGRPTAVDGFLRRAEIAELYAKATGHDLDDLAYYVAFAQWRLGCILQGVRDRRRSRRSGRDGPSDEAMESHISRFGRVAIEALGA